jgi:hypothetical protein
VMQCSFCSWLLRVIAMSLVQYNPVCSTAVAARSSPESGVAIRGMCARIVNWTAVHLMDVRRRAIIFLCRTYVLAAMSHG